MTQHLYATFAITTFSPGEAEKISGVSPTLQRDWRRRKILHPGNDRGPDGFSLFSVAELLLLKDLSNLGLDPKRVYGWTAALAAAVGAAALNDPAAWEDREGWQRWQENGVPSALQLGRYALIFAPPHGIARVDEAAAALALASRRVATVIDLVSLGDLLRERATGPLAKLAGYDRGIETEERGEQLCENPAGTAQRMEPVE